MVWYCRQLHHEQTQFQGFQWDLGNGPNFYIDNRLCFGLRSAPNLFNDISNFVVDIAKSKGVSRIVNYLDDFFTIGSTYDECLAHRLVLTSTLECLGFVVSWKKVTNPATLTTFLGITIDSRDMALSLPPEKLTNLKTAISRVYKEKYLSKKDLESIGGMMSFCSGVIQGGRTFLFPVIKGFFNHCIVFRDLVGPAFLCNTCQSIP